MNYGIASLSVISCKAEPFHASEQISQLLFGEFYTVIDKTDDWYKIRTQFDDYECWIHRKHHTPISPEEFIHLEKDVPAISLELMGEVKDFLGNSYTKIPMGSSLPFFYQNQFKLNNKEYLFEGNISTRDFSQIKEYAISYVNVPYLWGGRTHFGIDCSGFSQICYKLCGIKLPRDSYQQAEIGTSIQNISNTQVGDLVFFGPQDNKVNHVGLIFDKGLIIHASGRVKIEKIDDTGIFGNDEQAYTHFLKSIKRVIT